MPKIVPEVGVLVDNISTITRKNKAVESVKFTNNDDVLDAVLTLGVKKADITTAAGLLVVSGKGLESIRPAIQIWEKS